MLKKINYLLTPKDKKTLFILLIMSFFLSIIETVGITAIMPFISTASNPDLINSNKYYNMIYTFFNFTNTKDFVVYFGLFLIFFYIFRGVYTVYHGYKVSKFSLDKYSEFANKLYEQYLHLPYSKFVYKNSATLSKTIITEAGQLAFLVKNLLTLTSEMIILIMLYILLLMVDLHMTLILTLLLGVKVLVLMMTVSKSIKKEGAKRELIHNRYYRNINESLGNFKIIKFIGNEISLIDNFKETSQSFSKINIVNNTLQLVPKSVLEAVGLSVLMGVVIYIVSYEDNVSGVIPIISMYALALYRILPAVTRILDSYNNIIFHLPSLNIVYEELNQTYEREFENDVVFSSSIRLENITYKYHNGKNIFQNFNLQINKGQKIAFIGESGSGKSTLVDLICGIYKPSHGEILIDNVKLDNSNIVSWRKKIGYIPQAIYLFDGTIAENITFGRDYDETKLIEVLKQANVYDFIMEKDGFNAMVGEGGIQLSGGQKQRIGIARALYGDPEILVLDEATSALDMETESMIMDEIYKISEDKTLLIIAHRLSTIEKCDIKIDISKVK